MSPHTLLTPSLPDPESTTTARSCPPPPGWAVSSANTSQVGFLVGQTVPVTCPKGQQAKGTATLICRADQTWSPISAACESE